LKICEVPHFQFFSLMHDSFTARAQDDECPQPEAIGGWQATVYRAMKAPTAAMTSQHENNIFDLGEEGENGKGVLAFALGSVYDGYYEDLPLSLLKEDPPSGGKVSPDVWKLKGAHFLGTPESERSITIKSIWLKQLADQSTVWKARGLYRDTQSFRIPALWAMSSNIRMQLTSIDGGVRRRLRGCRWPISFKANPEGTFQRPRVNGLKEGAWYTTAIKAGFIHVALAAYNAFFADGALGLEHMPAVIAQATRVLLVQEYGEYVEEFITKKTAECNGRDGSTKLQIVTALKAFILPLLPQNERIDNNALARSLDIHFSTKVPYGTTERLCKTSNGKHIKLTE
jgi:hypothetical protein